MSKLKWVVRGLFGLVLFTSFVSHSAEITVDTGANTLRNAVSSATAGDVLILQDGTYTLSNEDLVIDKSVTIRAINAAATPRVYFLGGSVVPAISIQGETTDFIMQGIYYYEGASVTNNPRLTIVGAVNSVALLENQFNAIDIAVEQTYDADGNASAISDLIIVGNSFFNDESSLYNMGAERTFLFAGNKLSYTSFRSYSYGAEAHIIGNTFIHNSELLSIGYNSSIGSYSRVIGNSFKQTLSNKAGTAVSNANYNMFTFSGDGEFRNNIVQQGLDPHSATGTPGSYRFIYFSAGQFWDVNNNVFDTKATALFDSTPAYESAFNLQFPIDFYNNIIINNLQPEMFELSSASSQQDSHFANNLCYNNAATCDLDATQLTVDPAFVDDETYMLAAGSAAIDAGAYTDVYRDVDGSVVDLGIYGGAFPYSQFSSQLAAGSVQPYFYPLFEANKNLSNTGELKVKAVAIARQR